MSDSATPTSKPARERLLQAAAELFYDEGISATGIDAIIQRAGVAKQSLYNNFTSKAELVATYLEHRHAEWLGLYEKRLEKAAGPGAGCWRCSTPIAITRNLPMNTGFAAAAS